MYFSYGVDIGKVNPVLKINPDTIGTTNESGEKSYRLKVDIPKMNKGLLDAVVMVAYLEQGARTQAASRKIVAKTFSTLNELLKQVERNKNQAGVARTSAEIQQLKKTNKKAFLLGIENGYGIGKDLSNIQKFADMGVVYITLCHNGDNDICDAALKSRHTYNGLSEFGKQVVKEMNRTGIIVDISHTSEKTSFDVLAISEYPVIASHSSAKALYDHPRNISDELMKAIANKGGVIQICLYSGFLKKTKASINDALNHIDHVVKTVGIDHVGIGSDFDGGGGLSDLKDVSGMYLITEGLVKRGYSEEAIAKIWGGNFMRVLDIVKNKGK
jgi:microsomal dipeptidase-like Zn-dependent dipeptidase